MDSSLVIESGNDSDTDTSDLGFDSDLESRISITNHEETLYLAMQKAEDAKGWFRRRGSNKSDGGGSGSDETTGKEKKSSGGGWFF